MHHEVQCRQHTYLLNYMEQTHDHAKHNHAPNRHTLITYLLTYLFSFLIVYLLTYTTGVGGSPRPCQSQIQAVACVGGAEYD